MNYNQWIQWVQYRWLERRNQGNNNNDIDYYRSCRIRIFGNWRKLQLQYFWCLVFVVWWK